MTASRSAAAPEDSASEAVPSDLVRQIVVISTFVFMVVGAMAGTGLFGGTAVQDLQDGALDSDASYLAPARSAFSIWSVIYVGLAGYTVWQALPGQRARRRQRDMGWLIAGSMLVNGLWLLVAQYATLPLTVLAIVALLGVLGCTFRRSVITRVPRDGVADALLIDGVTGLHLGWVTLATVANTAAWLTDTGPAEWESAATWLGIAVLVVVGVIGLAIDRFSGWRISPALALAWGLSWLAVGRLAAEPRDHAIGITAIIVAAVVLLPALAVAGLRVLRPEAD